MRVVPTLDPCEHGHARCDLAVESMPVDNFALKGGEERFGHGIVVRVAYRPHRGLDAGLYAAFAEGIAGVLATSVRVMDDALRSTLRDRHIQRGEHQFGV